VKTRYQALNIIIKSTSHNSRQQNKLAAIELRKKLQINLEIASSKTNHLQIFQRDIRHYSQKERTSINEAVPSQPNFAKVTVTSCSNEAT